MGLLKSIGKGLGAIGKVASFIPGVGNVAGGVLGGLGALAEGKGIGGALTAGAANAIPGGGVLKTIGKALPLVSAGASMLSGYQKNKQANKAANAAGGIMRQQYTDFAPLRTIGLKGVQDMTRPDLTSVYRNADNPFA